jgi:hypothetical protein
MIAARDLAGMVTGISLQVRGKLDVVQHAPIVTASGDNTGSGLETRGPDFQTVKISRDWLRRFTVLGAAAVAAFLLGTSETSVGLQLAVAVVMGIVVALALVPGAGHYIQRPKQKPDQD